MSIGILSLILIPLGVAAGAISSIVGFGGGFLIVPALILIFNLPGKNVIGISVFAISGTAISATIGYLKQKRIDFKLGLFYNILDFPGVVLGAYLTTILPSNFLKAFAGALVMIIAFLLFRNKKESLEEKGLEDKKWWERKLIDSSGMTFKYSLKSPILALTSSFLGGFITGLSGLGGGITDTSTMIILGTPSHIAVATSEFGMALSNLIGVLSHGFLRNILFRYAIPLTIGTLLGAQIGCKLAQKMNKRLLMKIIAVISFLIGLKSFLSAISVL